MKRRNYFGDSRYEKIYEQMQLLDIQDVSSPMQEKNGTIVWRLPIKGRGNTHIEYGSFASGYVRNQGNQHHSNWQINKRVMGDYEYYPDYTWCPIKQESIKTGKFNRFRSKKCVTIPIEIDRLEYMMKYVIKNDFIKRAHYNHTKYVHIDTMQASEGYYKDKLKVYKENAEFNQKLYNKYKDKFQIAKQDNEDLLCAMEAQTEGHNVKEVTVIIDGHKYKLI